MNFKHFYSIKPSVSRKLTNYDTDEIRSLIRFVYRSVTKLLSHNEKQMSFWWDKNTPLTLVCRCPCPLSLSSGQVFGRDPAWNQSAEAWDLDGISLVDMPGLSPIHVSVFPTFAVPGSGAASAWETARFPMWLRPQTTVPPPRPNMRRDPLCEQCTCVWTRVLVGVVIKDTFVPQYLFSHRDQFAPCSWSLSSLQEMCVCVCVTVSVFVCISTY